MKIIITPLIVLLTLFFNLGCQPKSGSLSEVNGITSIDTSQYSEAIKPTTTTFETNFKCVQDNDRRIEMSYNENLDTIIISGYDEFKLKNVEKMETARGRPLEFTRYYSNDLGDSAVLTSQAASRYLELKSRKGSKTSYQITLGLECDRQYNPELLTYIIDVKKAYIYKEPDLETKTASYFIQGDKVDAISVKEGWIKVYYLDNKRTGWLRSSDLITNRGNTPAQSNNSPIVQRVEVFDKSKQVSINASQLKITDLPITIEDYTVCHDKYGQDFCKDRYPMYGMEDLPLNLRKEFNTVYDPKTVLRLPNINDIEVYILARNHTDVEEYGIVTYKDHIIDDMLIGKVGTIEEGLDFTFSISDAYQKLEITATDNGSSKVYNINEHGKIKLLE